MSLWRFALKCWCFWYLWLCSRLWLVMVLVMLFVFVIVLKILSALVLVLNISSAWPLTSHMLWQVVGVRVIICVCKIIIDILGIGEIGIIISLKLLSNRQRISHIRSNCFSSNTLICTLFADARSAPQILLVAMKHSTSLGLTCHLIRFFFLVTARFCSPGSILKKKKRFRDLDARFSIWLDIHRATVTDTALRQSDRKTRG